MFETILTVEINILKNSPTKNSGLLFYFLALPYMKFAEVFDRIFTDGPPVQGSKTMLSCSVTHGKA